MLDYIESISMMLLCLQAAYLSLHCHQWKAERNQFNIWASEMGQSLGEDLQEFGALLTDIADILDSPTKPSNPHPSDSITDVITGALISTVMGGLNSGPNAEKESKREISTEVPKEIETENESN